MSNYYILNGHTPVACDSLTWSMWFEANRGARRVASTENGDVQVSTVFLGINHQLFETMIFGGAHDEYQDRCSTWEEAEKMHASACKLAFGEPS